MSSKPTPLIRHATAEDVPTILRLIRELASYENELDAVEATEETLLQTLAFAPSNIISPTNSTPSTGHPISAQRPARCLLLFPGGGKEAVGMALYFYNYSTWRSRPGIYIEDLYVSPSSRGSGFGRALIKRCAQEVKELGGGRLELSVLKWNEPSIGFYTALGMERMEGWVGMRLAGDKLSVLADS
ncbi:acyl-CoA N-acyltransferase [Bisporella sp. PMI_857]|nr:acyl-CoA N-acyltransferase [Bisporella sp. PMI_857]